jgi:hypothetical protein
MGTEKVYVLTLLSTMQDYMLLSASYVIRKKAENMIHFVNDVTVSAVVNLRRAELVIHFYAYFEPVLFH